MAAERNTTATPPKREEEPRTGIQRALDNVPDIKRHLRNADAHIERARRQERRQAAA